MNKYCLVITLLGHFTPFQPHFTNYVFLIRGKIHRINTRKMSEWGKQRNAQGNLLPGEWNTVSYAVHWPPRAFFDRLYIRKMTIRRTSEIYIIRKITHHTHHTPDIRKLNIEHPKFWTSEILYWPITTELLFNNKQHALFNVRRGLFRPNGSQKRARNIKEKRKVSGF